MKKSICICILIFNICYGGLIDWNYGPGTTAASFLRIPIGAKNIGLGELGVAIADDVSSLYWNPGGLGRIQKNEITYSHNEMFVDIRQEYIGGVYKIGSAGIIGANISYLSYGQMDRTTDAGELTGKFTAGDTFFGISYGISPLKNIPLSIGATTKMIILQIDKYTGLGVALDIGCIYEPIKNLTVGLVANNMGNQIRMRKGGEASPPPATTILGIAYNLNVPKLPTFLTGVDISVPIYDGDPIIHLGTECKYEIKPVIVCVRMGYKIYMDSKEKPSGLLSGVALGGGVEYLGINVDYAFVGFGDLGGTHRITLGWKF